MDRSSICRRENSSYVDYGEARERSGVGVKKPPQKRLSVVCEAGHEERRKGLVSIGY